MRVSIHTLDDDAIVLSPPGGEILGAYRLYV